MKFEDLKFGPRPSLEGIQAVVTFPNGYGASIIKGLGTYGVAEGLYELAVIKDERVCYSTPVTSDVEGWLTPEKVTAFLLQIEALEPEVEDEA